MARRALAEGIYELHWHVDEHGALCWQLYKRIQHGQLAWVADDHLGPFDTLAEHGLRLVRAMALDLQAEGAYKS